MTLGPHGDDDRRRKRFAHIFERDHGAVRAYLLLVPGGSSGDAVAQAVRALSSRPGVFHVVARTSRIEAGGSRTRTWTETWASASGERRRSLVYDVRADGRRGRLVAERVGGTTVLWASPRDGGPIADGGDTAVRPQSTCSTCCAADASPQHPDRRGAHAPAAAAAHQRRRSPAAPAASVSRSNVEKRAMVDTRGKVTRERPIVGTTPSARFRHR